MKEKDILREFCKYFAQMANAINDLYPRVAALETVVKADSRLEPNYKRALEAEKKRGASQLSGLTQFATLQRAVENLPD